MHNRARIFTSLCRFKKRIKNLSNLSLNDEIKTNRLSKEPKNQATFSRFFRAESIPITTTHVSIIMHEILIISGGELSVQTLLYAEGGGSYSGASKQLFVNTD